ncbi:hypothetical protein KEM55_007015 [Ascosphaera atra]|nr:hypothetical protein KEM55_007015 [Ascosphaera atra]
MPINLGKVQKKISKKGKTALHEKSRDTKILRRAGIREEKLARAAQMTGRARQIYETQSQSQGQNEGQEQEQEQAQEGQAKNGVTTISQDALRELIISFINRHTPEIRALEREQRKNRPPVKRLIELRETKAAEEKEFASGFWVPDMTDENSVKLLKGWNGEWSALSALRYVRVGKDGRWVGSAFPPRGLS